MNAADGDVQHLGEVDPVKIGSMWEHMNEKIKLNYKYLRVQKQKIGDSIFYIPHTRQIHTYNKYIMYFL